MFKKTRKIGKSASPKLILERHIFFFRLIFSIAHMISHMIRIPDWLKFQLLIVISSDHWIKKRVDYFSCIEGKGMVKTFTVVHKCCAICLSFIKCLFILDFIEGKKTPLIFNHKDLHINLRIIILRLLVI